MSLQVTARELENVIVLDAAGRITLEDGGTRLRDFLHVYAASGHKRFLLDLRGVGFIDSYGVGELARCYSAVRRLGGDLKLVHVSETVRGILHMTKLDTLFEIHSDEPSALQSFPAR
jgi:anti-sigma B factor antagonist